MAELGVTTTIPLTIEKGADFYIPIQVQMSYCTALGIADLAGTTWLMSIRDTDSLTSTYYQSVAGTITDAANRMVLFFVTDTVNELLGLGDLKHDMWRTNSDFEHPFGKGPYVVTANRRVP